MPDYQTRIQSNIYWRYFMFWKSFNKNAKITKKIWQKASLICLNIIILKILIQMLIIKSQELYLSLLLFKLSGVQNRPRVSTKKIFQKNRKCEIGIIINRVTN